MILRELKEGMSGDDVLKWQAFLAKPESGGFFRGEVTGKFDGETRQATVDFQRFHELPAEGLLTNRTLGMALLRGLEIVA